MNTSAQNATMNTYRVTWEIDVDAASPLDAARRALAIQRSPESIATVFDVLTENETVVRVDLVPPEERA